MRSQVCEQKPMTTCPGDAGATRPARSWPSSPLRHGSDPAGCGTASGRLAGDVLAVVVVGRLFEGLEALPDHDGQHGQRRDGVDPCPTEGQVQAQADE